MIRSGYYTTHQSIQMVPTAATKATKRCPDEFFCNTNLASLKLVSWNPGMCQGSTRPTEPWPLQTLLDSCQKLLGKVRPSQVILTNYHSDPRAAKQLPFQAKEI